MRKILLALLAGGIGMGVAWAQQPSGKETKKEVRQEMGKAGRTSACMGVVEAVDAAAGTISVSERKGSVMVLPVTAGAKIMKAGKTAELADIKAGDKVHILYTGTKENPVVKSVMVQKAPGKKEMRKEFKGGGDKAGKDKTGEGKK